MIKKSNTEEKCGLCNKTSQEVFKAKGATLSKTPCCDHWICNDEHTYQIGTYSLKSCMRNHMKYTICGAHYKEDHKGDWRKCKKCKQDNDRVFYDDQMTNKFNFEPVQGIKKKKIFCCTCGFGSFDLHDFVGCQVACCTKNYFCYKPACRKTSIFRDTANGEKNAFMYSYTMA